MSAAGRFISAGLVLVLLAALAALVGGSGVNAQAVAVPACFLGTTVMICPTPTPTPTATP